MALYSKDMCLLSGPAPTGDECGGALSPSSSSPKPRTLDPVSHKLLQSRAARCVFPLTRSQEGIWVEYQCNPTSTRYNLTLEWNLARCDGGGGDGGNGPPALVDIIKVIHKLTQRHPVLRSVVTVNSTGKAQIKQHGPEVLDPEVRVVYREVTGVPECEVTHMLRRPFDLLNEAPARWLVLLDAQVARVYLVGHHIVVDGSSMSLISREFLDLLNGDASLPPLADFSHMHMIENAMIGTESYTKAREIVLDQVRGKNNLPWPKRHLAKPTPSQDYRKIDSWSVFSKGELDSWSNAYKTSWFRVAISLVGLVVADKTRPALGLDEVLSVAFAGRPKDMAACVGHFANSLPVKVPLWKALGADGSSRSFRSLVAAVSKNMSAVKKAEMVAPIEVSRACREEGVDYEPPRVAVTYSPKLARSECRLFPVEGSWDLFFCFLEYEEDVKLGVIYDPLVFSDKTISDMKTQFDDLIRLSKTSEPMLDDMLDWLPRHPSLPSPRTVPTPNPTRHIHHFFDAHAESSPSSIAIHSNELGISVTYGELYSLSEKKAGALRKRGIGRENKVVLHLRRGPTVFEWILAVLKAGAAFVYLDPDFAEDQKRRILANCEPDLVIDELNTQEMSADTETINLEDSKYGTADGDLAYLIYTSGSTGEPKGVMVEHGSIAHFVQGATTGVFQVGFNARVLQFAPLSFDASIMEWTSALCTGATLCLAEHPRQLVGEYLADVLEQNEVTWLQTTPTTLATLPLTRDYPRLRQIVAGGEAPSRDVLQRWRERVDVINAYGPTEAAIGVTFNALGRSSERLPSVVSAGQPTPTTSVYVCASGFGSILQPGFQGEICLAGPQLARGYCGQPELTTRSFATHPANGIRMYRTGDRGMLLEDGSVVIQGRMDRELKIRGHRIAPEEVEKAIANADVGVLEASVQASSDGLELVAVVAPDTVSTRSLAAGLRRLLPAYKVPTKMVLRCGLPRNTSGKIDHKAVKLMLSHSSSEGGADDSAGLSSSSNDEKAVLMPRVAAEQNEELVHKIWQALLGTSDKLPFDVNFFDIGGHSLLVPKLYQRLKDAFPGTAVRLVDLFHQSTIRQQAVLWGNNNTPVKTSSGRPASTASRRKVKSRSLKSSSSTPAQSLSKTSSSRSSLCSVSGSASVSMSMMEPETPATSIAFLDDRPEVAVVGVAGRFPQARNADEFYRRLLDDKYLGIVPSPYKKEALPGNLWVPKAGMLEDVEAFDHAFWHLSKEEATDMDPQQRLFLEVAYEALTDAGVDLASLNGGRTGIFVGSANGSYHQHTDSVATDPFLRENRASIAPSISARTAYHLNISGPNVTIQVNCASSTVALSQACDAIRLGRCDMAIVGGVSLQLFEGGYVTQEGQIFSPRGECNPFDARADGTVPADAVTAVVLRRYADAAIDSTPVYAKILGTGIGSDGALEKAGFQVPSPRGQAEVIKSAWRAARITPHELRYAEMHGSGTPVGDALELEGISLAVKELGGSASPFVVGSVKGNIGNTQHASGLVSLIKLCKSMQHGVVPATRGLERANDMIDRDLPLELAFKDTPIRRGHILTVCASGWGGVNTHTLLGFPDERLQKRATIPLPASTFSRRLLAAPRLGQSVMPPVQTAVVDTDAVSSSRGDAAAVFARHAAAILGCDVAPDTDLKAVGLDSKAYVALIKTAMQDLTGPSIGVKGLLLPLCSPTTLASLYKAQLPEQQPLTLTTNILGQRNGPSVLVLPGSEGSLAGAAPLLSALPQDATIMTIEHPGINPDKGLVARYVEAVRTNLTPVSGRKLTIVGISLGGRFAPEVAAALSRVDDRWAQTQMDVYVLDSPAPTPLPISSDTSRLAFTYVAAKQGGVGTQKDTVAQWKTLAGRMHQVDCAHADLWGAAAQETASIISAGLTT